MPILIVLMQAPSDKDKADTSRDKFTALESSVGTLIGRAEDEFPSAKFENNNYCYYQGRKFEPDNLACVVSYSIELGDAQPVEIYDFMVEQSDIVGESRIRVDGSGGFRGSLSLLDITPCNLNEDLDSPDKSDYELNCISDADEAYYKLR